MMVAAGVATITTRLNNVYVFYTKAVSIPPIVNGCVVSSSFADLERNGN
ncbi:MAG: hypothetical protein PHT51_02490 [Patescibacteria group bacterium]|nr:hypothetical protein [Patescibacteria group bacterium]MDD4611273.1 hypothetical protein [Patescibacteria group bacterium]